MGDDIETRLRNVIIECLGAPECNVIPSAFFEEDLGADSLYSIELMMAMEEEFGCEISDDEAEKVKTVQDAVALITQKTGGKIAA